MKQLIEEVNKQYREHFGEPAFTVRSPGRINLIGEHTDYNDGFVLPAAIDKAIYLAIGKRNDNAINLVAADIHEAHASAVNDLKYTEQQWPNYVLGVVDGLCKAGYPVQGFNAVIRGDVPLGAGLSSSAALECATVFALNTLYGFGLDKKTMVQLAQKAEHDFAGVKCGIMDQFASMFGKEGQLIQLDCRSLEYQYMPFDTPDQAIILFDTQVKHSLASSAYNQRRQECEAGVYELQQYYPGIQSLRDVSAEMVEVRLAKGNHNIYRRCRYVVGEIERLQQACVDLKQNNLAAFGKKMFETHEGLSSLYEVSCPELDLLVDLVKQHDAVAGARMMGGGFGGCTINIVRKEAAATVIDAVGEAYEQQFGKKVLPYIVSVAGGTALV